MREAQQEYEWKFDSARCAELARRMHHPRAILQKITESYSRDGELVNLPALSKFKRADQEGPGETGARSMRLAAPAKMVVFVVGFFGFLLSRARRSERAGDYDRLIAG